MSNSLWLTELRKEIEMAKTSGGVRGGSSKSFSGDARTLFSNIERGYGRQIDFSGYQTKKLQSLQRLGKVIIQMRGMRLYKHITLMQTGLQVGRTALLNTVRLKG